METTVLGRTGLRVSRMGLGCGGPSRLGLASNKGIDNAVAVIHEALNLGVTFIDTAEAYGNEAVVGQALAGGKRDGVVLSTKVGPRENNAPCSPARFRERVEACLAKLQTDRIDILHLHGVSAADYPVAAETLVPVMTALRDEGKIRFLGITEAFGPDPSHQMLRHHALHDDCWDVLMVGFSLLNQSARDTVLPLTRAKNIGVLDMFAVRRALSRPDKLRELMADLAARGLVAPESFDPADPLGFLRSSGPDGAPAPAAAASVPEASYRFCRDEPGLDVILSGTGSLDHLRENAQALTAPALPEWATVRLRALFAGIDSVSGN